MDGIDSKSFFGPGFAGKLNVSRQDLGTRHPFLESPKCHQHHLVDAVNCEVTVLPRAPAPSLLVVHTGRRHDPSIGSWDLKGIPSRFVPVRVGIDGVILRVRAGSCRDLFRVMRFRVILVRPRRFRRQDTDDTKPHATTNNPARSGTNPQDNHVHPETNRHGTSLKACTCAESLRASHPI
jgi:hypothetical protein